MYSNSDFEQCFFRYKSEPVTSQKSIQAFCLRNNVPYNLFEKWYRDIRHKLVPVKVEGYPDAVMRLVRKPTLWNLVPSLAETVRILSDSV